MHVDFNKYPVIYIFPPVTSIDVNSALELDDSSSKSADSNANPPVGMLSSVNSP